jgi:hypothetical protein
MALQKMSVEDLIDSLCGKSDAEIRLQLSKLEKRLAEVLIKLPTRDTIAFPQSCDSPYDTFNIF